MMADKPTVHIDVFFTCMGQTFRFGHGDVEHSKDLVEQAGSIASLVHELAWKYEEYCQREAQDGQPNGDVREVHPRKAWNRAGDTFFEVAPDEFVAGMSYEDAVESYRVFGGSSSLENLGKAFPGLRYEDIE